MFSGLIRYRHLRAAEFVDLLDGVELPKTRARHARQCSDCQGVLSAITELQADVSEPGDVDRALASVDWANLRSSVRDHLLSRAVKRSSAVRRWTGASLRPAAAWTVALVLVVASVTAGGLWHHWSAHFGGEPSETGAFLSAGPGDPGTASGGLADVETEFEPDEAMAWSQSEIFVSLSELEADEEAVLRGLISLAMSEDSTGGEAVLQ